jgi:hypothetical protein
MQGATPLHYAAGSKKADSVRLLLEDDWTGGRCPLDALDKVRLRWPVRRQYAAVVAVGWLSSL